MIGMIGPESACLEGAACVLVVTAWEVFVLVGVGGLLTMICSSYEASSLARLMALSCKSFMCGWGEVHLAAWKKFSDSSCDRPTSDIC